MNSVRRRPAKVLSKALTGIAGFDEITSGGVPRGRTTLLLGGAGSGKTVFALQFLAHGAKHCKEPGVFVAFEERAERIVCNAESFGWKLAELGSKKLSFVDAQPKPDIVQSGDFDLSGMLAVLDAHMKSMRAMRIVFDALDMVLALLPSEAAVRREVYRLHEWLLTKELTGIITLKAAEDGTDSNRLFGFMQFMVDCSVILNHSVVEGVSHRDLRVQKYRGSSFDENESPFLIGKSGFEVAVAGLPGSVEFEMSGERVSSGVERLDTMLGGGYYRGASVLITGFSGTAKTTLGGAFAEAACQRGERTMFISFDSNYREVTRNLTSVGIRLNRFLKNGSLRMLSARTISGSAETYLMRIKTLATEHKTRCLVIDPVSTWSTFGNDMAAPSVADRLIDWSKAEGITLLCTGLLDEMTNLTGSGSPLQLSVLADTWIHLNYLIQAGERNRGLSIVKSRGTAHSNQVRELILTDGGVTLADAYSAGGEVLMGTMRWEKERAERTASDITEVAASLKRVRLDAEEAELEERAKSLQVALLAKQREKALMERATKSHERELSRGRTQMREMRGADELVLELEVSPP